MTRFVRLFILAAAACASVYSQSVTATLVGTLTDLSGATVPEASLTLISVDTNETRVTTTSASGDYQFTLLRPGAYRLSAEKQGFKKANSQTFTLQVDQTARIDISRRPSGVWP